MAKKLKVTDTAKISFMLGDLALLDIPVSEDELLLQIAQAYRRIKKISKLTSKLHRHAMKLSKVYVVRKRKFFGRTIKPITSKSKDFKLFIAAANLMRKYKLRPSEFMDAQLEGLKFVNDGKGTFPSAKQLSTQGAEDRLLAHISKEKSKSEIHADGSLTNEDKSVPLGKNPKYLQLVDKMNAGEATLQDALYLRKCRLFHRGISSPILEAYIDKKRSEKQD